MMWEMEKCM
jgi:Recombinase.